MNINLDESLKSYVDEQVAAGRYLSADDLFADLLRDRLRESDAPTDSMARDFGDDNPEALRKLIQEGLDSGPGKPWTHEEFKALKRRVLTKHRNRG